MLFLNRLSAAFLTCTIPHPRKYRAASGPQRILRLFQTPFCLKRVASDRLRRTSAMADRNRLILARYQGEKSLGEIARGNWTLGATGSPDCAWTRKVAGPQDSSVIYRHAYYGEREGHRRARTRVSHPDRSPMRLDQAFTDRQPQPETIPLLVQ